MKPIRSLFQTSAMFAVAAVLAGCSSFRGDLRAARERPAPAGSVEGLWQGQWRRTDKPEHGGHMQMVLTREGDTIYRASARSQWWRIFKSSYDTTVVLTPTAPGRYLVQGDKEIWLFGGYFLNGRVDATNFNGVFRVGKHEGTIDLTRPAVIAAP